MTMTVMRVTTKNASTPAEREDSSHRVTEMRNWPADSQLVVFIPTNAVVITNNTSMTSRARSILYL